MNTFARVALVGILAVGSGMSIAGSSVPDRITFAIERQPLAQALQVFAKQTGLQVLRRDEEVPMQGVMAPRIEGQFSVKQALERLLANTGFTYRFVNDKTVWIEAAALPTATGAGTTGSVGTNPTSILLSQADASDKTKNTVSSGAPPSSKEEEGARLEEIVVTAEKRAERAQDVPVALTVLDPQILAENGQRRLLDYFADVPGLSVTSAGGGEHYVTIRGLSAGVSQNPTTATVVDDVPVGSSTFLAFGMFTAPDLDPSDLARIEVLKGPQGTLYGAASLGGLLKYVTADPSFTAFNGRAEASGVDLPDGGAGYTARAAANVPVSDNFAIRVSGFARRDPGFIDNVTTGQTNANSADVYGGHVSALYRLSEDLSLKLSALIQNSNGNLSSQANSNSLMQFTQGDLDQTGLRGANRYDTRWQLYTATVNAKLAGVDLVSLSGYNINTLYGRTDFSSFLYAPFFPPGTYPFPGALGSTGDSYYHTEKFSQEIRISSSVHSWLDWLAGGFYTHEVSPNAVQNLYANDLSTGAPAGVLAAENYWVTFSEYAVFGDLTIHFTDRLDLQVGGRQSWNKQIYNAVDSGPANALFYPQVPFVQPTGYMTGSPFTYLVTPRFMISRDLMIYARIATGYRIGGPNIVTGPGASTANIPSEYQPDKTKNYEIGVKADLFEHLLSLDAAAYYIDWKDFQLGVFVPAGFGYTTNAGDAKSEGLELSVTAHPIKGLTLTAQASSSNAVLTQDLPPETVAAGAYGLAGARLPYSIKFSGGLSANQDVFLTHDWVGFFGGAFNYVGSRPYEFAPAPPPTSRIWFPSYTELDLRTGVRSPSWLINLYANNVANRRGIVGIAQSTNLGNTGGYLTTVIQPRTVGLSVAKIF